MPDFRAIIALDINATDKEAARAFAHEIAKHHVGHKQRTSGASARQGGYEGSKASIYRTDLIEIRDQ